ncbi:ATP-binding protein [Streptosporangium sp. NPDC005286]|uniref:ATP-binding protein n=2 Tax=unclassified Streptosporangium TaxID=2632669 RepID=UPI0033BDF268
MTSDPGRKPVDMEFSLALPRQAIGIPMVRRALGDSLRSLGVTEDCVSDILLAVTEACANAVRHGGPANRYEVETAIGHGRCDVRIIDRGQGLVGVPEHYPSADVENGRGLLIMQAVVDEISFDITPGRGTVVHLRKHLDWDDDAAFSRDRVLAAV